MFTIDNGTEIFLDLPLPTAKKAESISISRDWSWLEAAFSNYFSSCSLCKKMLPNFQFVAKIPQG